MFYCAPHRFEDDHNCKAFDKMLEEKKESANDKEKAAILDKIKERSAAEQKPSSSKDAGNKTGK